MDNPTRVGLGGTALFTLAGFSQPLFGWWVAGPIMAVCAIVAGWGFWPIFGNHRLAASWTADGKIENGKIRASIAAAILCVSLIAVYGVVSKLPAAGPGPGTSFVANVFDIWASDDEIERFRKEGRTLVRYSPDRLSAIYTSEGEDAVSRYRGKWAKISHAFYDVKNNPDDPTTIAVRIAGYAWLLMYATFDLKKYDDRISQFVAPQRINAACQIDFQKLATNQVTFKGYNCEFEKWDGR